MHLQQRSAIYICAGNQTGAASLPSANTSTDGNPWLWLDGVDVAESKATPAIVAFGDSVTDGAQLTRDKAREWPNVFVTALAAGASTRRGARCRPQRQPAAARRPRSRRFLGVNGLARFDSDVLAVPGVRSVIVLLGLNDIAQPPTGSPETVSVDQITFGLSQLATRAHDHGLKIYVGTFTPFAGSASLIFTRPRRIKSVSR